MKLLYLVIGFCIISSCAKNTQEIDALISQASVDKEVVNEATILYSDSAYVNVRITAPTLERHLSRSRPMEEFTDGIKVEFLNERGRSTGVLTAEYATREPIKQIITCRRNVYLTNYSGEQLLTSELIWDEKEEILKTEKFVKLIQSETQDTTMGFGFVSNQDFTRFEIKRKASASLNADELSKALKN